VFFKSLLVAIAMSIARDDMGNIRDMHAAAGLPHNFRDASGGTDRTTQVYVNSFVQSANSCVTAGGYFDRWRKKPTLITPGKVSSSYPPLSCEAEEKRSWSQQGLGSNPYSGRMTSGSARHVEGRNDRAGPSSAMRSSTRHTPKRQKLGQSEQHTLSKYFHDDVSPHKRSPAVPSTSKSMHPKLATADAIVIDEEDDTPTTNDDPHDHDPIVVGTSSPDPMDFLNQKHSYAFDQKKPTPMDQFSATWEEERKSPQDGASTQRVRTTLMKQDVSRRLESASRLDSDGDDVQLGRPLLSRRGQSTARAEVSSGQGNVKAKVALIEKKGQDSPRHVNLLTINKQPRKNGMKPKQVGLFDLVGGTCN
jgi:hypothetical protein